MKDFILTWAPTANFKCCVDACGNDTKRAFHELAKKHTILNSYELYKLLHETMKKDLKTKSRHNFMSFDHIFMTQNKL